jgi:glyoxylase-like metal-dependent hydrolase (beta-lactamase superfamily II)
MRQGLHACAALLLLAAPPPFGLAEPSAPPLPPAAVTRSFLQPAPDLLPDLFAWADTCNVYVLRDGDAAILIDLGDGSVLDRLGEIGVKTVEWVLFTHHHREQLQGAARLKGLGAKAAAPEAERDLFTKPTDFRKMRPSLGDRYTVYGASYVRPPVEPVPLERTFKASDTFSWRGREIRCLQTAGHSPGGMSYLIPAVDRWIALSGDVMLDGARMHYWPDSEWDYGFGAGIYPLAAGAGLLEGYDPALLLPSHGPPVRDARRQLREYIDKLKRFEKLYLRGYGVNSFGGADQDTASRPTAIPGLAQVSKHLFKLRGPNQWSNFGILIADSGRGLAIDWGLDRKTADTLVARMTERLGLKGIDAVLITHMHGDHILDAPYLREKWGAKIWTLKSIVEPFEHPERFDFAAMVQAYGTTVDSINIDRAFEPGESFEWEGFKLTVDWLPGQTKYGCCVWGEIDGRRVAFTGDNLFGNATDLEQNGHEAVVAHNDAVLEEGYMYCADFLKKLKPDILMGGHSYVMDKPEGLIERFWTWSRAMRESYRELSAEDDYRYMYDPYWVRAYPYRVSVKAGESAEMEIHVKNFLGRAQTHRIAVHAPEGFGVEVVGARSAGDTGNRARSALPHLEGEVAAGGVGRRTLKITPAPGTAPGVRIVAFDVTLDGRRYGERFDSVVQVK